MWLYVRIILIRSNNRIINNIKTSKVIENYLDMLRDYMVIRLYL